MGDSQVHQIENARKRGASSRLLSGMQIRKKLIVIHTTFSLTLGIVLLLAIRPAMSKVIISADIDHAGLIAAFIFENISKEQSVDGHMQQLWEDRATVSYEPQDKLSIPDPILNQSRLNPEAYIPLPPDHYAAGVIRFVESDDRYLIVRAYSKQARQKIQLIYILVIVTIFAGYTLVAITLEIFVLPEHVYRPIGAILDADAAVSSGDIDAEIIPESEIPADEIGAIMRSRNHSVSAMRKHERELAKALERLEITAADLHRKNHLLETARKNLEGADRLASLGMMSAGIAHELNTPLSVVTGLVEKLKSEEQLSESEINLLSRVVGRLVKLSEGLLDIARVRPPISKQANVYDLSVEACTLVKLDRSEVFKDTSIRITNLISKESILKCDPSKMIQVFVNLIRNAVDALYKAGIDQGHIQLSVELEEKDGADWMMIRIEDNGPGIASEVIDRLFEPFVSTRLDSHGTGLGLAVTNGIVREHGGVLVATNQSCIANPTGACFEIVLPLLGN